MAISVHDLVCPPRRGVGNPLFVKGSNMHPQKVRARTLRRFMERAFNLKFGKSLDDVVAETIEETYGTIIGELRIRAEWGDEEARVMLNQRVLEIETMREVRALLKVPGAAAALEADRSARAPANTGLEQA